MKKIFFALSAAVVMASCGGDTAADAGTAVKKDTIVPQVCTYSYDSSATEIGFGAFKFTEKKEVKGSFLSFDVTGTKESDTLLNVFSAAKFTVSVASVSTGDISRDYKIKTNFFGTMDSTTLMTGWVKSVDTDSSRVIVAFKINNVEKDLVLNYTVSGDELELKGSLSLLDYKAQKSVDALNKACKDLHKGTDGVSKTWSDVNIYIKTKLKNSCK
ncbi:MAG: YceI family protein [Flavobacteriales bacterium]